MSNGPIPKKVDPRKFADRGVRIAGEVSLSDMPNFQQAIVGDEGHVQVDLQFSLDERRIRTIQGSAEGYVFMTCQRCLEPVKVTVEAEFNLGVAYNEEKAVQLPRYYDPLIVENDEVELLPVIEEELILSMPHDAYHDDCEVKTFYGDAEALEKDTEKPNPFSVLAQLKASNK